MIKSILLLFIFLSSASSVFAYPGMQRYGYFNCTACHVSPSGGGVLNPYGRSLSGEILSAWSTAGDAEKETKFLYGAVADSLPKQLLLGGDTRILGTDQDTPQFTEKRFFLMQSDLEGAYKTGKFTFDLEMGYVDSGEFLSLRHYLLFQWDDENAFRLGKFKNNFGINTDEHQLTTKDNLGFGAETETYNLEYSHLGEKFSYFLTAIFGAPESETTKQGLKIGRTGVVDHGVSGRASYSLGNSELGVNYFYGKKANRPWRSVPGMFSVISFSRHLYYLAELDFQSQTHWGVFDSQRMVYEYVQGLQLLISQELAQPQFGTADGRLLRYGVGAQFFPRPHYEISVNYNWERDLFSQAKFYPFAWLLLHVYL